MGFPSGSEVKNLAAMQEAQETLVQFLGLEDSPGEGNGNPLQYSRWENPMDGGAWWATAHRVTKSQTLLSHETHTQSNYTPIQIYFKNNIHDDITYTLEEEMATHSSILAWQILWTEDTGGLQSIGSQSWTRLSD